MIDEAPRPGFARHHRRLRAPQDVVRHPDRTGARTRLADAVGRRRVRIRYLRVTAGNARRLDASPVRPRFAAGPLGAHLGSLAGSWSIQWQNGLAELDARKAEARVAGGAKAIERHHAQGQDDRPRAHRVPARRGLVPGARHAEPPRRVGHGPRGVASLHRRGHHRLRHDRRPQGLRVLPGLHRLRRRARRDARREDPQDHGPGDHDGAADHRAQRRRRRAHPRGRRRAQRLRRDLPPQRPGLGRRAPDLGRSSAPAPAARSTRRP